MKIVSLLIQEQILPKPNKVICKEIKRIKVLGEKFGEKLHRNRTHKLPLSMDQIYPS